MEEGRAPSSGRAARVALVRKERGTVAIAELLVAGGWLRTAH